nr:hypothetical protein [Kozakia baliensis]
MCLRLQAEWRANGREHALRQGSERRSNRIEARADISLIELTEKLATEHGVRFVPSTIWCCLDVTT